MEVIFGGALFKSRSSNSAVHSTGNRSKTRNMSDNDVGHKMEVNKKRGVYVEKWENPKHHGEDKRHPKPKAQPPHPPPPRTTTQKLLTSAPAESKISTFTRLLGTADPVVRFIKRKSAKKNFLDRLTKQASKTTPTKQSKNDIKRNVEENQVKKFRSTVLKQRAKEENLTIKSKKEMIHTPSTSSKLTRDISYDDHWSSIFQNRESTANTNLLQEYICNYKETVSKAIKDSKDEIEITEDKKDDQVYNFFVDLLESVYDEDVTKKDLSGKSSDLQFEVDDQVAQTLLAQDENPDHYTIKDDIHVHDQSRQLADYYNNKSPLVPQTLKRRRKKRPVHKTVNLKENKPKKANLLNLLKQQLSLDFNMQEEPQSMYEALLNIAKTKRRPKQIYFENTEHDIDGVCRFKRRNVISPSTRMKKIEKKFYSDVTTGDNVSESTDFESTHSLEVLGFDYDENDIMERDSECSDLRVVSNKVRYIRNLNEGITTVTHNWKH